MIRERDAEDRSHEYRLETDQSRKLITETELTNGLSCVPCCISLASKNVNPMKSPPTMLRTSLEKMYAGFIQYARAFRMKSSFTWYSHLVANSKRIVASRAGRFRPSRWIELISACTSANYFELRQMLYQSSSLVAVAPAPMTSSIYSALGEN